mmetsp:Transcript_18853/g.53116  ORF Transcript_18853/g.53116 Transcript_18853/m.53116 type:complete len:386 (-) Transcript_18853:393-1550(-)
MPLVVRPHIVAAERGPEPPAALLWAISAVPVVQQHFGVSGRRAPPVHEAAVVLAVDDVRAADGLHDLSVISASDYHGWRPRGLLAVLAAVPREALPVAHAGDELREALRGSDGPRRLPLHVVPAVPRELGAVREQGLQPHGAEGSLHLLHGHAVLHALPQCSDGPVALAAVPEHDRLQAADPLGEGAVGRCAAAPRAPQQRCQQVGEDQLVAEVRARDVQQDGQLGNRRDDSGHPVEVDQPDEAPDGQLHLLQVVERGVVHAAEQPRGADARQVRRRDAAVREGLEDSGELGAHVRHVPVRGRGDEHGRGLAEHGEEAGGPLVPGRGLQELLDGRRREVTVLRLPGQRNRGFHRRPLQAAQRRPAIPRGRPLAEDGHELPQGERP